MKSTAKEHIKLSLTPSWLSGSLAIIFTLFLLIAATIVSLDQAGSLQNDLFALNYVRHGISDRYGSIASSLNSNHIISQLPLWMFWGSVGLVTYLFSINLFRTVIELNSVKNSLHYVHANPKNIVKQQLGHLLIRSAGLLLVWVMVNLFFKNILPFCLSIVRQASLKLTIVAGLEMLGLICLLLLFGHLLTLAFRLALLKPRVFGF